MIISILLVLLVIFGVFYTFYKEPIVHLFGVAFSEKSFDNYDLGLVSAQSKSEVNKQIDISQSGFYSLLVVSSQPVKKSDFSSLDISFKIEHSDKIIFKCGSSTEFNGYVFAKNSTDYITTYSKPFYLESDCKYLVDYNVNNPSGVDFSLKIKNTPSP